MLSLRIELARQTVPDERGPLAIVIARPGSTIKDERSLLGNSRLDEVCPEARARGLSRGQTIASARSRCAELRVRVVSLDSVATALGLLAEALLAFGATTSFDLAENVVWVDVTGCAHLHQSEGDRTGERTLAERARSFVLEMGHACAVAMADGPHIALAVARFSSRRAEPVVVPSGDAASRAFLGELPLAALPLESEAVQWLSRLGMRTVAHVQELPRASLRMRLGTNAAAVMALLEGQDRAPLSPHVPAEEPEEIATLEYGIETTDALLFVVKGLADRMAIRLAGRVMAAMHLELVLGLDPALAQHEPRASLNIRLAAPLAQAGELLGVLRSRVESFVIEAPILTVTLRVCAMVPRTATALHMFVPEAKAERALPRLVAELEAELGPGRVGILTLAHRWLPNERSKLARINTMQTMHGASVVVPRTLPSSSSPRGGLLSGAPEPTRLLGVPMMAPPYENAVLAVRLELVEWWSLGEPHRSRREYAVAWIESLSAVAWLERDDQDGRTWIRGWMD